MMEIINLDKKFLQEVNDIFNKYGYGNVAYDELGFLFSDYFMDTLEVEHEHTKGSKEFLSLKSIRSIRDL